MSCYVMLSGLDNTHSERDPAQCIHNQPLIHTCMLCRHLSGASQGTLGSLGLVQACRADLICIADPSASMGPKLLTWFAGKHASARLCCQSWAQVIAWYVICSHSLDMPLPPCNHNYGITTMQPQLCNGTLVTNLHAHILDHLLQLFSQNCGPMCLTRPGRV